MKQWYLWIALSLMYIGLATMQLVAGNFPALIFDICSASAYITLTFFAKRQENRKQL